MMVLCSNHSSRAFHAFAQKHPGKVGWLFGPSSYKKPRKHLPFALDNDAFGSWINKTPWNEKKWMDMLEKVKGTGSNPMWVLVPDVVADKNATLERWHRYSDFVRSYGWSLAFAAQDGMVPSDVPNNVDVVFIGGTKRWKWKTLPMWTEHFDRVHVGRVTTGERLEIAERNGAESVDGTGFFRGSQHSPQAKQLFNFVEGHRNQTPFMNFDAIAEERR